MSDWFKSEVTDDRGVKFPGLDLKELKTSEEATGQRKLLAERLDLAIKVEGGRGAKLWFIRIGIFAFATLLVLVLRQLTKGAFGPAWYWVFFAAAGITVRYLTRREINHKISVSAVTEGFCGSCGYSLQSSPRADDGCVTCAECGAGWNAGRIRRPHWNTDVRPMDEKVGFKEVMVHLTPSREFLTVADDRGRYVRSLDRWLRLLRPEKREKWGEATIAECRRRLARIGRVKRIIEAMIGCALFLLPVVFWLRSPSGSIPREVEIVIGINLAGALLFTVWKGYRGSRGCKPTRVVKEIAAMGFCGACGEPIAEAPVEADGCKVCPSCTAAWRSAPAMEPETQP